MNAYVRTHAHNHEVLLREVAVPTLQSDEVLVKVEAFGVGIHDRYFIPKDAAFPYVIGSEGAGVVVKKGTDVVNCSVGDRVLFTTSLQVQGGCWAEYAAAKESVLIPLPAQLTFTQGAAIPIAGKAALECMRELNLSRGDSLFVAGGSGAIGTFVLQMAATKGVRVSASASLQNHAYMKALGAEKTVDYTSDSWMREITEWCDGGVTAALAIQPGTGDEAIHVVKNRGRLICVSGDHDLVRPERDVLIKQMGYERDTQEKLSSLVGEIASGSVNVFVEKEYSFDQALDALVKTETRHARGKQVVRVNS